MFTGLIETIGRVEALERKAEGARLVLEVGALDGEPALGESIAIDGICLSVSDLPGGGRAAFDVAAETLRRTTLGKYRAGRRVNLERALRLGDRLGGHMVQGHVDGTAALVEIRSVGEGKEISFSCPEGLTREMAVKGSVAVDGISLTLIGVSETGFSIAVIPHTLSATTLGQRRVGEHVNVETDVLAKYVARRLELLRGEGSPAPGLTEEFLREHGFG